MDKLISNYINKLGLDNARKESVQKLINLINNNKPAKPAEPTIVTKTAGSLPTGLTKVSAGVVDYILTKPAYFNNIVGKKITKIKLIRAIDEDVTKTIVSIGKVTLTGSFDTASQTVNSLDAARATMTSIHTYDFAEYNEFDVVELECDITLNNNEVLCFDTSQGHCVGFGNVDGVSVQEMIYHYTNNVYPTPGTAHHVYLSLEYEDIIMPTQEYKPLEKFVGKKISIIGDSISTFEGYNPSGYDIFYPKSSADYASKTEMGTGSLLNVQDTWWYKLCQETGLELLVNASWSGSRVTGSSTSNTSALISTSNKRIADLKGADGTTPDIVLVYIGINDLFNTDVETRGATLGDWKPNEEIVAEGTVNEFSAAYALMLKKIITAYPESKVFCCTLLVSGRDSKDLDGKDVFPTKCNGVALNQVNDKIREIANGTGCNVIDVHNCGLNYFNLDRYTIDRTHPNSDGATLIKNQMLAELIAKY